MKNQITTAVKNGELLSNSFSMERNSKLDYLIQIKEYLTRIEDAELVNNNISDDLIRDLTNLSFTLQNTDLLSSVDEVEYKIYGAISKYFMSKAVILNHQLKIK